VVSVGGAVPSVELGAQGPAVRDPGGLDVFQRHGLAGVGGADGPADEDVAVVDADFGHVAGVVADGDPLPDVGGQGGVQVADALKVDPVAVHDPGGCNHDQEQVQLLGGVGGAGQPSVRDPPGGGGQAGLGVGALVVTGQPGRERGVQGGQGQPGRGCGFAADEVAGQQREQLGGDGPEESFDLPAALRASHRAVDKTDVQVGADLVQVVAGEVAAVVGVQDLGQTAHDPPRVGLRADGLPQRQ